MFSNPLSKSFTPSNSEFLQPESMNTPVFDVFVCTFFQVLVQGLSDFPLPDVALVAEHSASEELGRLLQLVLGCAVKCERKQGMWLPVSEAHQGLHMFLPTPQKCGICPRRLLRGITFLFMRVTMAIVQPMRVLGQTSISSYPPEDYSKLVYCNREFCQQNNYLEVEMKQLASYFFSAQSVSYRWNHENIATCEFILRLFLLTAKAVDWPHIFFHCQSAMTHLSSLFGPLIYLCPPSLGL